MIEKVERLITEIVCGVWARVSQARGATVEGARILAFVLTIPFGGFQAYFSACHLRLSWNR